MAGTQPSSERVTAQAALVRDVGGPWTLEEIDVQPPGEGEVRVRMVATGMCHTDMVCRDGFPVPMPIVLGHEGAGVVDAIGPNVDHVGIGDHVVLSFNSCGNCANCANDDRAYCYDFVAHNFGGTRPIDGSTPLSQNGETVHGLFFGQSSFATYAIARAESTVPITDDVPLELMGPLGCGIQTGAGAVMNSLNVREGQTIVIFGGGAVGLSAVMAARAVGAGRVVLVEPHEERRSLALQLGADAVIDPTVANADVSANIAEATAGGAQFALDTTGMPDVIGVAAGTLLPKGVLGMVGVPPQDAQLPLNMLDMLIRGLTAKYITEGDATSQTFIPKLVDLYKAGKFPFDRLITKFAFADINEAAKASEDGKAIKPVLVF